MKIYPIPINKSNNNYSKRPNKKVCLKNSYVTYQRPTFTGEGIGNDLMKTLSKKLNEKINERNPIIETYDIKSRIESYMQINSDLADITEQYKLLNENLKKSDVLNFDQDRKIVIKFINDVNNLSKDKGFNSIGGYSDIKKDLTRKFINNSIIMSKTSQNTTTPNALMFFGPNGGGKTSFAKALAEQSLSNIKIIDCGKKSEEETYNDLLKALNYSKEQYKNSKENKTRTMIILNEGETILNQKSPVIQKIKSIIPDISKNYKATLLITSNYPEFIDTSILKAISIKIPIPPADRDTAKKIIDKTLELMGKKVKNTDEITEKLFLKDAIFSNGIIKKIIKNTYCNNQNPKIEDFEKNIMNERPNLTKEDLKHFEYQKEYLNKIK